MEAREMIGGAAIVGSQNALKPVAKEIQTLPGGSLQPRRSPPSSRDGEIEGSPHPRDSKFLRDANHRIQHRRSQMCVLVRIEMSGCNAGCDDLAHLRRKLFMDRDLAAGE